ncbi:MAG: hypothetical protein OEW67_12515 [Cyclobacteriaceae bacterium]|nr:hypothetical protein [Cyclobacteriaceae bacterium]
MKVYKNDSLIAEEINITGYDSKRDKLIDVSISNNDGDIQISALWFVAPNIMVRNRNAFADNIPESYSMFECKTNGTVVQTGFRNHIPRATVIYKKF